MSTPARQPSRQHELTEELPDVVTRRGLLAAGWTRDVIRHRVRSGRWIALLPGTYVTRPRLPETADEAHDLRLRAAVLHHGGGVAVLNTAARVHGLLGCWPDDGSIHLRLRPGRERHQVPGTVLHTWLLRPDEIAIVRGMAVTTASRTVADLMCRLDRMPAVSVCDSALNQGLIHHDKIPAIAASTARRRGARRARDWWSLTDGRAQSPLETRVRLRAIDGGFAPDTLQLRIGLPRGGNAYGDLAWRMPGDRWLVAEADGRSVHEAPDAVLHDRRRANQIAATGRVELIRFTWQDTLSASTVPGVLRQFLPS